MLTAISRSLAKKRERLEGDKGFTLIELLVVVIIIGILAAIAIPIFLGQQEQAKGAAVESALSTAKTKIVASIVENNAFPTAAEVTTILTAAAGDTKITLTLMGDAAAFCIDGVHSEVTTKTWAVDDNGGVLEGTCVANVATP